MAQYEAKKYTFLFNDDTFIYENNISHVDRTEEFVKHISKSTPSNIGNADVYFNMKNRKFQYRDEFDVFYNMTTGKVEERDRKLISKYMPKEELISLGIIKNIPSVSGS